MEDPLQQCPFDLLPDAMAVDILSRLARSLLQDQGCKNPNARGDSCEKLIQLQLVCRRWQGLLLHLPELGWKLRGPGDERGLVKFLLHGIGSLRRLRLSVGARYRASPELQGRVAEAGSHLQELEVVQLWDQEGVPEQSASVAPFDYAALLNMLSRGGSLHSVTFTNHIALSPIQPLLTLPSILHLNLTSAYVSDNTLQVITESCTNLETLHLDFVRGLQDTLIQCPTLQSLTIERGPFPESLSIDADSLTFMHISVGEMLSIAAPKLQTLVLGSGLPELDVRQPWDVSSLQLAGYYWNWEHIETLLRVCPGLTKLDVDVKNQLGPGVSVPMRTLLWELCPNVRELKLALGLLEILDCSEEDVERSGDVSPLRVAVFEVDNITESTLRQLDLLKRNASLESLELTVLGASRPALSEASGAMARLLEEEEACSFLQVKFEPACPGWTQWRSMMPNKDTCETL